MNVDIERLGEWVTHAHAPASAQAEAGEGR